MPYPDQSPDSDILSQLQAAAGMGDQEAAFHLQMLNAQKLRGEQAVAPHRISPMGALFSGAARVMNTGAAQQQQGIAQGNLDSIGQRRRALIQSLPTIGGPTAASLSAANTDDEANTITGGVVQGIQRGRALERALGGTGDKTLGGLGAQYGAEAKGEEAGLFKAAEGRDTRALRKTIADNKNSVDLVKLQTTSEWKAADLATKMKIARIMGFKFVPTPGAASDGYVVDAADETATPIGARPVDPTTGAPLGSKAAKPDDPEWLKFVDRTDPTLASSRTTLGQYAGIIRQVNATKALYAPGAILTPQQLSELGIGLARTIGGQSGATHRGTIQDVAAKAFGVDATKFLQYFSGKPEDIPEEIKGPWAKHFMDVLTREEGQAVAGINSFIQDQVTGKADVVRRNLRLAIPYLQRHGFSEKQINDILAKSAPPPARAPAAAGAPLNVGVAPVPAPGAPAASPAQPAAATPPAGNLTPPRADGKVRIMRNGKPGWVTTPLPGDQRI